MDPGKQWESGCFLSPSVTQASPHSSHGQHSSRTGSSWRSTTRATWPSSHTTRSEHVSRPAGKSQAGEQQASGGSGQGQGSGSRLGGGRKQTSFQEKKDCRAEIPGPSGSKGLRGRTLNAPWHPSSPPGTSWTFPQSHSKRLWQGASRLCPRIRPVSDRLEPMLYHLQNISNMTPHHDLLGRVLRT